MKQTTTVKGYILDYGKNSKRFGDIYRMTCPDNSKVYLTKRGLTLVLPKGKKSNEITIRQHELVIFLNLIGKADKKG